MADTIKKCKRQGCNKQYTEAENNGEACKFHNGKPIFHDLRKGWTCCEKIVYDWDEFQKLPGCCTGPHTDEKQEDIDFYKSNTVQNAANALAKDEAAQAKIKSPADYNRELEEQKKKEEESKKGVEEKKEPVKGKDGLFICANKGCKDRKFDPEKNTDTSCHYHSGEACFHDLKKFWTCCTKVTYDWDDFMKLDTCAVGRHEFKYK